MKYYLECTEDGSSKFWQLEREGKSFTVTYGKIGTAGKASTKTFASEEEAEKEASKLVASKLKKGYVDTSGEVAVPAAKTTDKKPATEKEDALATEIIRLLDEMETELMEAYAEVVKAEGLCELEKEMGADFLFIVDAYNKRSNNTPYLNILVQAFYAQNPRDGVTLEKEMTEECKKDIARGERTQMKALLPTFENLLKNRINNAAANSLYSLLSNDVDLRFNSTDNGWFDVKISNSNKQKSWKEYVKNAIITDSYQEWKEQFKQINTHLSTASYGIPERRIAEKLAIAFELIGEISIKDIMNYCQFIDTQLEIKGYLYATEIAESYLEKLLNKESLKPEELSIIMELNKNTYFMQESGYANDVQAVIIKNGGKEKVPVAKTIDDVFEALESGLIKMEEQLEEFPFTPTLFEPTFLKGGVTYLLWKRGHSTESELVFWNGARVDSDLIKDVKVPFSLSMIFDSKYHKDFQKDVWEKEDTQKRLEELLVKRMKETAGKNIYQPLSEIKINLMPYGQYDKNYSRPFYLESFNKWKSDFKTYLEAGTYKEDFPLEASSYALATLFAALTECDKELLLDFLNVMTKTLKEEKISFKKYNSFGSGMLILFSGLINERIELDFTQEVQEGLLELANFYLKNGAKSDAYFANELIEMLKEKGSSGAQGMLEGYEKWHNDHYWYRYDPADLLKSTEDYSSTADALIKVNQKGCNIAISFKEETEASYRQAIEYLLQSVPAAMKKVKANYNNLDDINGHFNIAVEFLEQPMFPPVKLYGTMAESNHNYETDQIGFMGLPELALFTKAAQWESLWGLIREYAEMMLENEWRTAEGSELDTLIASSAVVALALADKQHFDLVEKYAHCCDDEHEDIQLNLIPAIRNKYGLSKETVNVIGTLAGSFQNGFEFLEEFEDIAAYIEENYE